MTNTVATATETALTIADVVETETCSRCGGSGHYSRCASYGTKCFRCHGTKMMPTKRGVLVQNFIKEKNTITAGQVKVGQRIACDSGFGQVMRFTVASIKDAGVAHSKSRDYKTGEWTHHTRKMLSFTSVSGNNYGMSELIGVRLIPSPEANQALLREALAYRDTLTKAGKLRKR